MAITFGDNDWAWVVVQDPGGNEHYLGQQEKDGTAFIPVFAKKEHALMCLNLMTRDRKKKYEAQAVIYSELKEQAASSGFMLYILDEEGRVLDKIDTDLK
ncbi:MAG: hypothetical protein LJE94_05680 [Deltaproteobacteria bacterium]|jgi:DNA helicase TIP49 (TBP-interacting protein)|nr:hypothetical protein [Deltaproteobacteria bacterium]